jgi:hypothetical protein
MLHKNLRGYTVRMINERDLWYTQLDDFSGMIYVVYSYIPPFMKTSIDVQAIFRFYFMSLNGRNVGITDGRDL